MLNRRFSTVLTVSLVFLQLTSSIAYAGFLYLPFAKNYPPVVYFYDSYTLSKGWKTYGPSTGESKPHEGTDYRGDGYGTKVYAAASGKVIKVVENKNDGCDVTPSQQKGFGNYVKIDHGNGYVTIYAHLKYKGVVVKVGQKVEVGDLIGYVSNSGCTRGSDCRDPQRLPKGSYYHLHFEVQKNGVPVNPYNKWTGWLWATDPPKPATKARSCKYHPGQNSSRKKLFQEAYDRSGGWNKMGCAEGAAYWWKGMVRQDFKGRGTFGEAAILHDEKSDNPKNSLPAYVVHGGIWKYYRDRPIFGPPASDEYKNAFGHAQVDFRNGFVWWGGLAYPRRYFIKGSLSTVYLTIRGRKYPIPNSQTKNALGFPSAVSTVSNSELKRFPAGPAIADVNHFWIAQFFNDVIGLRPPAAVADGGSGWFETHWGKGSPAPGVPADNFSSRFVRQFPLRAGTYVFEILAGDGIQFLINNKMLLNDRYGDGGRRTVKAFVPGGQHILELRHVEKTAYATLGIKWLSDQWAWIDTGGDESLGLDLNDTAGGGVQLVLDGQGGSGGWTDYTWAAKDIPDVPVTSDLRVYWEQYDKAHSLLFGLVVEGTDGEDRLLTYAANADNHWGREGWVDMGPRTQTYSRWENFARDVRNDYYSEFKVYPKTIKELRAGHFVRDSWKGDHGGTIKNIIFDFEAPSSEVSLSPSEPNGSGSWYTKSVSVSLSASDDASGVSKIQYSLGSGWKTYTEPFTVSHQGKTTVHYRAVDKAGRVEATKSVIFRLDSEPPLSVLGTVVEYQNSLPISIPVSSSDSTSGVSKIGIYKRKVGESKWGHHWTSTAGLVPSEFNVKTLAEGKWEFASRVYDVAGNVEPLPSKPDVSLIYDKTAPTTELGINGPSYEKEGAGGEKKLFVSPKTSFELEAYDTNPQDSAVETSGVEETNYHYHTLLYDSGELEYTKPFSLEREDGKYQVEYSSRDNADNKETTKTKEIYLDSTPPESLDDSDGQWQNEDVTVTITSEDPPDPNGEEGSGVQKIVYKGAKEGEAAGDAATITFEDEGTHELSYHAVDNVENVEEEKKAASVKVDKTPPDIEGAPTADPNEAGWYKEDITVHFEAGDQEHLSGLKTVTPDVIVSAEGADQEVVGVAEDNAGNTASTIVGGINVDKTAPKTTSSVNPEEPDGDNGWYRSDIEVVLEAFDNKPDIKTSGVMQLNVRVNDHYHTLLYDSGEETDASLFFNEDGIYEIEFNSLDWAGNVEGIRAENHIKVKRDNTAPSSAIISLVGVPYYNAANWPGIFGVATDNLSGVTAVEVRVDKDGVEGEWMVAEGADSWAFPKFVPADGFYTAHSRAVDAAGNQGPLSSVSFVYDNTSPVTASEIFGVEGLNGWYVSPITLALDSFDLVSGIDMLALIVRKDGKFHYHTLLYDSEFDTAFTEDGEYVVDFWATDLAGNAEAHQTLLFKIDTTAPALPTASVFGGSFAKGEVLDISLTAEEGTIYYSLGGIGFTKYILPIRILDSVDLAAYTVDEAGNASDLVEYSYVFLEARGGGIDKSGKEVLGGLGSVSRGEDMVSTTTASEIDVNSWRSGEVLGASTVSASGAHPAPEQPNAFAPRLWMLVLAVFGWSAARLVRRRFLRSSN